MAFKAARCRVRLADLEDPTPLAAIIHAVVSLEDPGMAQIHH